MPMCVCVFTFLLGAGINFDGVDGSSTGLVFRLFENFLRLRLSAAKAPNPIKRSYYLSQLDSLENIEIDLYSIYSNDCLNIRIKSAVFKSFLFFLAEVANS